jgi:hypothetical protein
MIHVNLLSFCQIETCIHDMNTELAFEIVSKIIFDRACQLIIGGNPAFESEKVLFHIEMCMNEWGYKSALVSEYCDAVKQENDHMRDLGIDE